MNRSEERPLHSSLLPVFLVATVLLLLPPHLPTPDCLVHDLGHLLLGVSVSLMSVLCISGLLIFLLLPTPPNFPSPHPPLSPLHPLPGPVTQIWANLEPLTNTSGSLSCRLTVYKHWLKVEYTDTNLPKQAVQGEQLPSDLHFLAIHDQIDLRGAKVQLLPASLPTKDLFDRRFPVQLELQEKGVRSEFVFYSRSNREKEDLYRSLVDGINYAEDAKLEFLKENCHCYPRISLKPQTRGEIKADLQAYMFNMQERLEEGTWEACQCHEQGQPFENNSLTFINGLMHRMFYDVGSRDLFLRLIRKKLFNKLRRVKFLSHFPDHYLGEVTIGSFPPVLEEVQRPYQDRKGLFLTVKMNHSGGFSARVHLQNVPSQGIRRSIVGRLRDFLWGQISFRLDVTSLKGELCLNIPQEPTDRIWVGFSTQPQLEMNLVLMVGDRELQKVSPVFNLLVSRLLLVLLSRVHKEFWKGIVMPNMNDMRRVITTSREENINRTSA